MRLTRNVGGMWHVAPWHSVDGCLYSRSDEPVRLNGMCPENPLNFASGLCYYQAASALDHPNRSRNTLPYPSKTGPASLRFPPI